MDEFQKVCKIGSIFFGLLLVVGWLARKLISKWADQCNYNIWQKSMQD